MCGGVRISAYCNDWHSCCGVAELGPGVEVLLDLSSYRQLVLILWHAIILENTKNKASATSTAVSHCMFLLSSTWVYRGDSGERTDFKILNLHWPRSDRAPVQLCISARSLPAASQWSEPTERHVSESWVPSIILYYYTTKYRSLSHYDVSLWAIETADEESTSRHKPWQCQTHCPSMGQGNQVGPSKSVQKEPPDLHHYCGKLKQQAFYKAQQ